MQKNIIATNAARHTFINGVRCQVINDKTMYGVTSILGQTKKNLSLKAWQNRVGEAQAEQIKQDAADFGSTVHRYIENYLLHGIPLPPDIEGNRVIVKTINLVLSQISEVNLIEYSVYHKELNYCGTLDCLGVINGKLCLIDWKTSKTVKPAKYLGDYKLQAAAYYHALQSSLGVEPSEARIFLFLKNERSFQQITLTEKDLNQLFEEFKVRLRMFEHNLNTVNKRKHLKV